MLKGFGQPMNLSANFLERAAFAFRESVGGIAIGAAQVASGQTHKHTGQPCESAFALETEINLVDDQSIGHAANSTITANRRTGSR
jgi:hypothetical protein